MSLFNLRMRTGFGNQKLPETCVLQSVLGQRSPAGRRQCRTQFQLSVGQMCRSMSSMPGIGSLRAERACSGLGDVLKHSAVLPTRRHVLQSAPGRSLRLPIRVRSASGRTVAMASKIELYSLATPNGMKAAIALEEMGLEYNAHRIHIGKNEQFSPEFIAINPNSKIPAIVDPDGPDGKPISVFESGAILLYLAEKTGKFLSPDPRLKWETIQWVFFQMAGVGPMFGQFGHFYKFGKDNCKDPYPVNRYATETKRLLGVLDKRLEGREFLVGDEYSIADIATFPWVNALEVDLIAAEYLGLSNFPNVMAWKARCIARPATAKGMKVTPFG